MKKPINIKDIDLNNPDHYQQLPDMDITISKSGKFQFDEADVQKMLKWLTKQPLMKNNPDD